DVPCAGRRPGAVGELRRAVECALGPFGCARDLSDVSAYDFSRSAERDVDAFCRQGLGTLVAKLGEGLPVLLGTPARTISWTGPSVEIGTPKGYIRAFAVIVTASTGVLATGKPRFDPELPKRISHAFARLSRGSYDNIALELAGNPLGLQSDELVFEKATSNRTAAILGNVSGTALCLIEVGGRFGASLATQGEAAMVAFATDWLADLY